MAPLHIVALVLWTGAALPAAAALPAGVGSVGVLPQPSSIKCPINLTRCGDVDIPYPFGFGPDSCAMPGFNLTCNETNKDGVYKPFYGNVQVLNISLQQGQATMLNHISSSCTDQQNMDDDWQLNFVGTPYRFSDTINKFTVIGCETLAYIANQDNTGKYMSGCVAMCRRGDVSTLTNGSCSGIGCCQTAIPKGLQYYQVWFDDKWAGTMDNNNVSPCSYGVLMDSSNFTFLTSYATTPEFNDTYNGWAPLVVDWSIGNENCKVAQQKPDLYACKSDNSSSECFDSPSGTGYICNCSKGYTGNPYIPGGCQDIDECKDNTQYPCYANGSCRNKLGGFECVCPPGTRGNATSGPCMQELSKIAQLAIGICASVFFSLLIFLAIEMNNHRRQIKRQDLMRQRDAYFYQHGGQLLKDMMKMESTSSFKLYGREEIELATNNFDNSAVIGEGGQGTVYEGSDLDADYNPVAIKKCKGVDENRRMEFGQELLILSRVKHENIVKLLGCSLQFEAPVLVYEFVPNKTLHYLIHDQDNASIRTLEMRLKIAAESAEAFAYLHSLNHPIIHGDVKSANILLGHNLSVKVSDFGCSMLKLSDETVQVVKGTMGYLDPEYLLKFELTDKSDVYSFGVILLELLTRRKALSEEKESLASEFQNATREGSLVHLLDNEITGDQDNMEFVNQIAGLAGRCLDMAGERRPTMRQVAEELRGLLGLVRQRTGGLQDATPLIIELGRSPSTGISEYYSTGTAYYDSQNRASMSIEFAR